MDSPPVAPPVSYVLPVLNEEGHLPTAVAAILDQDYAGDCEVILSLGPSTDGTNAVASALAAGDPRIRLVDNPVASSAAGMNRGLEAARNPIIVRVDSHTDLPPDYTTRMVAALRASGAAIVGGVMHAVGGGGFQSAVARAYNSPFGLGGASYHGAGVEGEAESAYLGVFRAEVVRQVGGYDETLMRGSDWDLARRIREAGHRVWLVPSVEVDYWPRSTVSGLRRQFFATGVWRGHLVRVQGRTPLRYLAPPALVVAVAAAPVAAAVAVRTTGPVRAAACLAASAPLVYGVALVGASAVLGGKTVRDRAENVAALATMHLSWGLGFLRGWAAGTGRVVDRSRVSTGT